MTTTATATTATPKTRGINLAKVNVALLISSGIALELWSESNAKQRSTSDLVESFDDEMKKRVKGKIDDLMRCDTCGGRSTEDLDKCPYCGTGDDEPAPSAQPEKKEESMSSKKSAEKPEKAEKPAKAPKVEKAEEKHAKAAEKAEKPAKAANAEEKPKAEEKPSKKAPKAEEKPEVVQAIVEGKPAATSVEKRSERDLNTAVEQVQILKAKGAVTLWELGAKIKEIHDKQLYKLRTDDAGKPRYKGFESFVNNELGMSASNAYELMDVSAKFTEQQVKTFGTSKLGLLLKAPEESRAEILDKVEKNKLSANEVRQEVRKARESVGIKSGTRVARDKGRKAMPQGKGGPTEKAERITIANVLGRHKVKLWVKGTGKKDGEKPVRAKKISDQPWGVFELSNSVKLFAAVTMSAAGELELVVDFKRDA